MLWRLAVMARGLRSGGRCETDDASQDAASIAKAALFPFKEARERPAIYGECSLSRNAALV